MTEMQRDPAQGYFQDTEMIRRVVTEQDGRLFFAEWLNAALGALLLAATAATATVLSAEHGSLEAAVRFVWIPAAVLAAVVVVGSCARRVLHEPFPLFTLRFRKFVLTELGVYAVLAVFAALLADSGGWRPGVPLLLVCPHLLILGFYTVGSLQYTAIVVAAAAIGVLLLAPEVFAAYLFDAVIAAAALFAGSLQLYYSSVKAPRSSLS